VSTRLARSRRHLGWPLLLLLASFAATALTAWQAHRAAREHRRTAERLLGEYAAFAAWSYTGHAERALGEAAWLVVNPILHRHEHDLEGWPDAPDLIRYYQSSLDRCECEPASRPGSYFAFALGADTLGVAGDSMRAALRAWVPRALAERVRSRTLPVERYGVLAARVDGEPRLVGYGLMPMARGDTMVYGFTVDPATVPALFERAFDEQPLLPATVGGGRPNARILAVRVAAPDGALLWQSPDWPEWEYAASDVLRPAAGGLAVRAAVRPALADAVLAGGLPSGRPPLFIALMLLLSAGFTAIAVRQLRRDEELARLRSDFVSSVSHELRTPLAQIRLFLETLRLRRYSTEDQREWLLGHLDRETTRLTQLVENVLAFASAERSDGTTPVPVLERADLSALAEETVRSFLPLAASKRVQLRTALADGAVARLDRAACRQLLLNLLDNAVKYGPPEQTVTVSVQAANGRPMVRLAVEDEGPGIPAAERERIWEPFWRGGEDAVRSVGGSGIGLALVRELARRQGGRAFLDPEWNGRRGARFVVELPGAA